MSARVSKRGMEMLSILKELGGTDSWGEVWSHYDGHNGLDLRNFDRVADALILRKLITVDDNGINLTEAGQRAVAARGR